MQNATDLLTWPNGAGCTPGASGYFVTLTQTAYLQIYLLPIGANWNVVLTVTGLKRVQTAGDPVYFVSNFVTTLLVTTGSGVVTVLPTTTQTVTVGLNTTTTLTQSLFGGEADAVVTITTSAVGKVTTCQMQIVPTVTVNNNGAGWHDVFVKV
jgi:hypothetical protein